MLPPPMHTSRLDSLQSSDELGLLDAVDKLRSQGVSHYVSLPQLIVCGDQSSGKSSVLEAISGVPFPTKDNLCTRFATELILRRTSTIEMSIAIVPSQSRPEAECLRLSEFRETLADLDDFPTLIDKAKEFMGISNTTSAFSNDVLRVEISGPNRPHLTIVDLPGLIHSENKLQTSADVSLVLSMVQSYMADPRSIILAVVSAKNDYANQIVTKLAKDVDFKGYRTLGIITKPDTLPVGSESEIAYTNLARNKDAEFRLGWHVLRNRDYETRNSSIEARDQAEERFFSQGLWKDLPRNIVGIASLRVRLSKVLLEQIKNELPSLLEEIEATVEETQRVLDKLGAKRTTIDEQRLFLLNISQSFQSIVKAAVDGTYGDAFFGDPRSVEGYSKRLRAVVQNLNLNFAETMRTRGHQREIVDHIPSNGSLAAPLQPQITTRANFLDDVTEILKRTRGRELPGMFSPLIVGDLFHEQSQPWEKLTQLHLKAVLEATRPFLELATLYLTDEVTAEALLREVIDPLVEDISRDMTSKLAELMAPYQMGHPITYNHYFTETIQNLREKRLEAEVGRKLSRLFGHHDIASLEEFPSKKIKSTSLISALASRNEADMDRYASSEVLDCMQAYYKVAMKSLIDNVAIQVVEAILLGKLGELLSPALVLQMKPDLISKMAAESLDNRFQREHLFRKLMVLQAGIETCKRYVGRSVPNLQRRGWHAEVPVSEDVLDGDNQYSTPGITEADVQDNAKDPPDLITPQSSYLFSALDTAPMAEPASVLSIDELGSLAAMEDNKPHQPKKPSGKKKHRLTDEFKWL